ncbi:11457_t:CDS:2 [Dentiscutata erythropus]|uniref:5-formyltetrahydrofolate cyclo-ligase n=1 Tax=Dentiscutata erythropus TaxID=1348616 RepID=A0A9N9I8T7_9GLOM|nr:11457_t:CDS:2 [Dentiscutata erythropus]
MGQPVRALKKTLRKEMGSLLNQIPLEKIEEESAIVVEKVISSQEYLSSTHISVYLSMPKAEISTKSIIHDIFSKGKICYVPRWDGDSMEMVKLESLKDYTSLKINKWNIPEPDHDQNRDIATQLDLIIMPGLAFDLNRNRLGHGKGYYDKYLTKCRQWSKPPLTTELSLDYTGHIPVLRHWTTGHSNPIWSSPVPLATGHMALALDSQILRDKDIPVTDYDQKPDFILSPLQDISI